MEMLIVMGIIAIAAAIAYPAVNSGVDTLRLNAASNSVVSFLNSGLDRAERRQQLVEIIISREHNRIALRGEDPGYRRDLDMPEGVVIAKIHPEIPGDDEQLRRYVLFPGGTIPRFGVELVNRRGVHRIVSVDPILGAPVVNEVNAQ